MNIHIASDSEGTTSGVTAPEDKRTERQFESHQTFVTFDETDNEITLHIDLPGADAKALDVQLSGRTLTVKQEKREETKEEVDGKSRVMTSVETSKKEVVLPVDVFPNSSDATLKGGVLHISFRKKTQDTDPGERVTVNVE